MTIISFAKQTSQVLLGDTLCPTGHEVMTRLLGDQPAMQQQHEVQLTTPCSASSSVGLSMQPAWNSPAWLQSQMLCRSWVRPWRA